MSAAGCEKSSDRGTASREASASASVFPVGTPGELIAPPLPSTARILALGDSYTIGESVAADERYPNQLVRLLRKQNPALPAPAMLARTGWTAGELLSAMDGQPFEKRYDLVLVLIGVNNQYRGQALAAFLPELDQVLDRATALARGEAGRVVVVSIPDWGVMPFNNRGPGVSGEIDAYNAACETAAGKRGMTWVNITPISRECPNHSELGAPDGLHPSGVQYGRWAEAVAPAAAKILEK